MNAIAFLGLKHPWRWGCFLGAWFAKNDRPTARPKFVGKSTGDHEHSLDPLLKFDHSCSVFLSDTWTMYIYIYIQYPISDIQYLYLYLYLYIYIYIIYIYIYKYIHDPWYIHYISRNCGRLVGLLCSLEFATSWLIAWWFQHVCLTSMWI